MRIRDPRNAPYGWAWRLCRRGLCLLRIVWRFNLFLLLFPGLSHSLCLYFSFSLSFSVSISLSLSFFLALSRPRLFVRLLALSLFPFFLLSCCLYLSLSLSLTLSLSMPFVILFLLLFPSLPLVPFFTIIFPCWFKNTHVTSNNRFLVCYTHYRDDENSAFGSFKLDGLSDFTYTRLCRRSASGPVCTLLSLVLSSAQQGYLYKLRKIGVLRAIRARTSHTNSALQGNARTDRFCRSFHSSRPRATATLLMHARVRAFMCASKSSVRTCVRQSAAIIFASTNQNG